VKRTQLYRSLSTLAAMCCPLLPGGAAESANKTQLVYFGTYTGAKSQGIYFSEFDPKLGTLAPPKLAAVTKNPTFLALNRSTRTLYAVNEVADFGGKNSGSVSAFKFDARTGALVLVNEEPSGGSGPCHIAVSRDESCVLVANYGSGSVAVLPLEANGRLKPPSTSVQHRGSSTDPRRQEGPHAHFITCAPYDDRVLACDLGLDQVLVYRLGRDASLVSNNPAYFSVRPGSGPRHLAFDASGRFVYILNELSSTLTICSYDSDKGALTEKQTVSTLPATFRGNNTCAEIQLHPSGRALYASNRGDNSIAVFSIDSETGAAKLIQHVSTSGRTPRHFSLDLTGKWLIAENQDSDSVVVFKVDADTGRLTATGASESVGAPVCAVFAPKEE
jgi:6-phosphogluconolactonase